MDNPKVRVKINKHVCAVDKKERYFTNIDRATLIDDETLIKYASDDSGIRIEQIAAVYRSLFLQVKELVCNGHSMQLGTLKMSFSAKAPLLSEDAGAKQIYRRRLLYYPSPIIKDEIGNTQLVNVTKLS